MSHRADQAYSIEDLRQIARSRLPRALFDFFDGGAEDEITLRENSAAFQRTRLLPRVLRDVSQIELDTSLLGGPSALPFAIAPTGALGYGRPGADLDIARAAVAAGIPYTLSSTATASIERIAEAAPGRLWFQAYILRDKPFLSAMIERARVAQFEALVTTLDLPVGGKRERDFHNGFAVPFRFNRRNLPDFACHPRWVLEILRKGMPVMENLVGLGAGAHPDGPAPGTAATAGTGGTKGASALASSVGRNYDASFDWEALARLREQWPRKMIVKGVCHPGDAQRLAGMGIDALVVSNHGGRQLDGGIATFDALPAVVEAVGGRVPVLMDGGIRRGSDILKALASGAAGVLLGRATLFGAMADGQDGAARAIAILRDELQRTMQLCGVRRLDEISADLLAPHSAKQGEPRAQSPKSSGSPT